MNREIKFRGKRVDNGEWVYGDLAKYLDGSPFIMPKPYFATRDFCDEDEDGLPILSDEMAIGGFVSVIPETVGQFTGLKDKNGVDIYEVDILDFGTTKNHVVNFEENRKTTYGHGDCGETFYIGFYIGYSYGEKNIPEIVGNIHDNPELL